MRSFCYQCFRPSELCLCAHIPRVDNRTEIVVLQHEAERFHPFGSVRMLMTALGRGQLHVAFRGFGKNVHWPLQLPAGTALLYPRPDAIELSESQIRETVERLVLLDGTWSQAHRLYRDNPWLRALPHVKLTPRTRSRYQVRREPKDHCLSTLEAAVEALNILEPDTGGLGQLLSVFERMNVEQVRARGAANRQPRRKRQRGQVSRAVPEVLRAWGENLVVVYAESAELATRRDPRSPELLQCCAVRVAGNAVFHRVVLPARGEPTDAHLSRLQLQRSDLPGLISEERLITELGKFLRPDDVLLAWNYGTFKLLPHSATEGHPQLVLKSCYCNARGGHCGTLEDVVFREQLTPVPMPVPGRAGQRIANACAVAGFLAQFGDGRAPGSRTVDSRPRPTVATTR